MEQEFNVDRDLEIPELLPVIPTRDLAVFPFIIVPLSIGRDTSVTAVDAALAGNRLLVLVGQRDPSQEDPGNDDLHRIGTVATIMRMLKLPDGRMRILVQGVSRCSVEYYTLDKPYREAKLLLLGDLDQDAEGLEEQALMRNVKSLLERSASMGRPISSEVLVIANSMENPGRLADLVSSNIDLKMHESQAILEELNPNRRLKLVNEFLSRELTLLEMQQQINSQARGEMDRTQRDFYLRQQLKVIQAELGEVNELQEEISAYRAKIEKMEIGEEALTEIEKQLKRLENMHPDTAETGLIRTYLDWMTDLPWGKYSKDSLNLQRTRRILDEDHFGLDDIKERILEFLSVRKLNPKTKNPILCFVGPPGVGKTSLGRSIARALGRQFVRLSLGGVRDEAEVRGHRKTYVGALPGRIVQGIAQAKTMNPVFVMDEVDKIGQDFRGDPSAALLEVLDPEQNDHFRDHYLGVPFDLSKVMFILTANSLDTIQPAFRDRMEIVELSSYTMQEKLQIAVRHIVPKQIKEHGLSKSHVTFQRDALRALIEQYTREAGLRNMQREIGKVCRKVARKVAEGEGESFRIRKSNLKSYLGVIKNFPDKRLKKPRVGVVVGLAWTPVGGEILIVEASQMNGTGRLTLTGQLGDVMKESAQIALSLLRSRAKTYKIDHELFKTADIHVHFPEGAIPKDGPSAGITVATALLSILTGREVRCEIAMTGELTLRGEVLAIGGLKEKVLAAVRAGISEIIIPRMNEPDLEEIPEEIRAKVRFHTVRDVAEVLKLAVLPKDSTGI